MTLESYLTLSEAARKYGISTDALTRLVKDGIIRAVHNEEGDRVITVSTVAAAADVIRDEIRPEQYEHLRGKRIRLMEAARTYQISEQNLFNWSKQEYIRVLDQGVQRLELDAADAKYVTDVFKRARDLTGSSIKAGWVLKRVLEARKQPSELG